MQKHVPNITPSQAPTAGTGSDAALTGARLVEHQGAHHLAHGRENADSYTSYYLGMDRTRAQKVALSTAHMPTTDSLVYDMGFGTGSGSYDLSQLYPHNTIVGVDIDPNAIQHAGKLYRADNLSFTAGDISVAKFPAASADVIFCSSILHEVLSYAETDRFHRRHLERVLDAHTTMLKPGGKYIVRDFISAQWPRTVLLDLPTDDGAEDGPYEKRSTVSLFRDFTHNFRCRDFPEGNVTSAVFDRGEIEHGWRRFMVPGNIAQEFILRRNYTERWKEEMPEEYSYCSQPEFEAMFLSRGLRVVTAQEVHNPWIVSNWFDGRFRVSDCAGNRLPFPPTNFLIVGEKVREGEGVLIRERTAEETTQPRFLQLSSYRTIGKQDGRTFDVVSRPGQSTDFLAYHHDPERHELTVLVRSGYPRPILNANTKGANLDNATTGGYTLETVTAALSTPGSNEAGNVFSTRTGMSSTEFSLEDQVHPPYFPSPGTSDEAVEVRRVRLARKPESSDDGVNYSQLSTSGELRALDSRQTLRAFQVGGMSDPRLEINIYRLHLDQGVPVGTWIGASVASALQTVPDGTRMASAAELLSQQRSLFEQARDSGDRRFFTMYAGTFEEVDAQGRSISEVTLEYTVPTDRSTNTAMVIPYARVSPDEVVVFLEERDFAAVQKRTGSSALVTIPGFRLDLHTNTMDQMMGEVTARSYMEFGITAKGKPTMLGGKYHPSIGFSPETAYPLAVEVDLSAERPANTQAQLRAVGLKDLLQHQHLIQDAHLLTALFRLSHALGEVR